MNLQLLVDRYKELQSRMLLGINLERVYCTVNANTFFIYTMQMSDLWGLYSSSGEANSVIHSALDDPDIPLSPNKLRWLGCNVYNLGCVSYQRDCFTDGVPLLAIACEELRVWCFAGKNDEEILTRIVEVMWPNNPCNFSNILCGMKCLREFATFVFCGNKQCYSLCTLHCM